MAKSFYCRNPHTAWFYRLAQQCCYNDCLDASATCIHGNHEKTYWHHPHFHIWSWVHCASTLFCSASGRATAVTLAAIARSEMSWNFMLDLVSDVDISCPSCEIWAFLIDTWSGCVRSRSAQWHRHKLELCASHRMWCTVLQHFRKIFWVVYLNSCSTYLVRIDRKLAEPFWYR